MKQIYMFFKRNIYFIIPLICFNSFSLLLINDFDIFYSINNDNLNFYSEDEYVFLMEGNSSVEGLLNMEILEKLNEEKINVFIEYPENVFSYSSIVKIYWSRDDSRLPLNDNSMYFDTKKPDIYLGSNKMKELQKVTNQGEKIEVSNIDFDISKVLSTQGYLYGAFDTDIIIDGYSLDEESTQKLLTSLDDCAVLIWSNEGEIQKETLESLSQLLSSSYIKNDRDLVIGKKVLSTEDFSKRFVSEAFVFSVMLVNFMVLAINYWTEKNKRNISIYKLMGASNIDVYISNFLQLVSIVICSGTITVIIQMILTNLNSGIMGNTRPLSYLVILTINIIILGITAALNIIKMKRISPNMLLK